MRATNLLRALLPELRAIADWPIVVGTVELTGGAVVAKRPPESACVELKAATARILRLQVESADEQLVELLAARYGVPVRTR